MPHDYLTMQITPEMRRNLLSLARQHWLDAEAILYAYDRAFQKERRNSRYLKMGTIVAAILTALSTAQPMQSLTVIAGLITAALATIEQQYSPEATSQKFWECREGLEGVKRDLNLCAISLREVQDLSEGTSPFTQFSKRISDVTKTPVEISDADRQRASFAFSTSVIAAIIKEPVLQVEDSMEDTDEFIGLAEDAPDVVATFRG